MTDAPRICCALVLAGVAAVSRAQVVSVSEGTNLSVALSPDEQTLVIDLLGGLWQMPAGGGGATELVAARSGIANPRFHPDGGTVVFQKWAGDQWDIWTFEPAIGRAQALVASEHNEREPEFSADGGALFFSSDRGGTYAIWSIDLATGALRQLTEEPGAGTFPTVSTRGDLVYAHRAAGRSSLRLYADAPVGVELYQSANAIGAPSWRPGGSVIVFNERSDDASALKLWLADADEVPIVKALTVREDVFVGRAAWPSAAEYLYAADGQIWRRGIASGERSRVHLFAGARIAEAARPQVNAPLDAPGPHRARGLADPHRSPDGSRTVFAALGDLWVTGRRGLRRLTDDAFVEQSPQFTPDGERIVFAGDRGGKMDLWLLGLDDAVTIKLTSEQGAAFEPRVAPLGDRIAFLSTDGAGMDAATEIKLVRAADPFRATSVASGLRDVESLEWMFNGGRARLRVVAREAPSAEIGELFFDLGPETGTAPAPEASTDRAELTGLAELEWRPEQAEAPYVIEVGRLFDGVRNDYQRHMDIHVEGQRIVAVTRRGLLPHPERVLDFSDATVIPGLIDTHAHHSRILGERLGRAWLAHGVTTVREVDADLYAALERAESWASARRPGPRLVIQPRDGRSAGERSAPIPILADKALLEGFAHGLAAERARLGFPELGAASIALPSPSPDAVLAFSALGRSYGDVVAAVVGSERFLSTGLSAAGGPRSFAPARNAAAARALGRLYSPGEEAYWSGPSARTRVIEPLADTLGMLVRAGARIAVGSDAPATPYGYGLHLELAELAAAGIANDQVLRLATASAASALGLDGQLGTLEPGKLADLVVIDGDPLAAIGDALRIVGVVKAGVWHAQESLLERPSP
jgi:Tol biopolymer transport system component